MFRYCFNTIKNGIFMDYTDFSHKFDFENGFYLTSSVARMSKFATHLELFRQVSGLAGDIVECGVFKGASLSRFIKFRTLFENESSKKIHAFDTFDLYPEVNSEEDRAMRDKFITEAGDLSISRSRLIEVLKENNLYNNIELIGGDIQKSVPEYLKQNSHLRISLLHIDVDLYGPTNIALQSFYPHVVQGGIVILDDYGAFAGANRAIEEFFEGTGQRIRKLDYSNISFVEKGA